MESKQYRAKSKVSILIRNPENNLWNIHVFINSCLKRVRGLRGYITKLNSYIVRLDLDNTIRKPPKT